MKWQEIWAALTGKALAQDVKKNREAADALDRAVREVLDT